MNRPGDRVRRLATRLCSERTRRRLIDPAVADLQEEVVAARRTGSPWRTWRALGAGYVSIAKVLAVAACGDLRDEALTWRPEERAGAWRGVRIAVATTSVATVLWVVPIVSRFSFQTTALDWDPRLVDLATRVVLGVYLLPSTLALTVPLGLVLGIAWTLHGAVRTRKVGVAALVLAAICSVGMFINLAWLTPEANQAYRQIAIARYFHWDEDRPLARGPNELTLTVVRDRLQAARQFGLPQNVRFFETLYYGKFATTVASLPMVGIILALAYRRRWERRGLTVAAAGVFALYYAGLWSSGYATAILGAPPLAAAWLANAMCAAAAMLLAVAPRRPTSSPSRA